jgi:hypothetical protein
MGRVARYDGLLPQVLDKDNPAPVSANSHARQAKPSELRAMVDYIHERRTLDTPFEVVVEGKTPGDDPVKAAAIVKEWADAGATWWNEAFWDAPTGEEGLKLVLERIRQGPPRF